MKKIEPRKLKGFADYSSETMALRYQIMDEVRRAAGEAGFEALQTPAIEYAEVLLGEGGETDKQVFMWEDNGGRSVALRYDLTVPFARFVAENGSLPLPYKRFQIGDVWRAEKPQKGRFREFCQCDFDIIGADSLAADFEVILAIMKVLSRLNRGTFTMTLGHRHVLGGLLKTFLPGVFASSEGESACLIIVDKLDKIGPEKVATELAQVPGATLDGAQKLLNILEKRDGKGSDLASIRSCLESDEQALAALGRMESLLSLAKEMSGIFSQVQVVADLKIARGLAYYTGVVFETTFDSLPQFGSVSSGGRYDRLTQRFVDRDLPGVGGSIGLDRLVAAFQELGVIETQTRTGAYLVLASTGLETWAFKAAEFFRGHGILCEVTLKPGKLAKQFAFADKMKRAYAIIIGEEENSSQTVSLKNLTTGDQQAKIDLNHALNILKSDF